MLQGGDGLEGCGNPCVEALGLQSLKRASWPPLHCAVSWGVPGALIESGSLGPGLGQPPGDADESRCRRELLP